MNGHVYLLIFLGLQHGILGRNPGGQIRLSQQGIQYAGDVLVQKLSKQVTGQTIPDQSGEARTPVGKVKYEFRNMRVTSFSPPKFTATVKPGQSLSISLSGASLSIHGDWKYKIKILFPVKDSGSMDVSLNGITISENVVLGEKDSRLSISSAGCSCSIGDVHVDIHTGLSWLYNLFKDKIEGSIKDALQKQLCELASKEINVDAEESLAKMKINVPVVKDIAILKYGLTAPPKFGPGNIDVYLNGEVLLKGDAPGVSGLNPAPFTDPSDTGHMVYFWLSDFIMDTLGYSLQKRGFLTYNLTKDDLDKQYQHFLNIFCDDSSLETKCIGSAVPQLRKYPQYKNGSIVIGMWSTQQPRLQIVPNGLRGVFKGNMAFFVKTPNDVLPTYVFTINVSETFMLKASLTGSNLTAQITSSKIRVDILDSHIGKIEDAGLQWIFSSINTVFIKGKLNELGVKGFELPKIRNVVYVNPQFQLMNDSLVLMTNVKYEE